MTREPLDEERARLARDPDHRAVLTVLDEAEQPLRAEELAERLVTRDVTLIDRIGFEERLERTLISLHHDRLPRLAEADLVEYDRAANVVSNVGSASPDVERRDATTLDELVESVRTSGEDGFDVIRGRESVVRYGRRLADEAEDELFGMYVSTDLLEEACVRRAQNAIDRGVAMYLGSRNSEARDLVREHLPEATVWEPQLDWMNAPTGTRVGRLVVVDRRKVMLAVLEESPPDGEPSEETAVVGEGEEHPLVVLVRELLGSRLDHLDFQSEAFRSELSI